MKTLLFANKVYFTCVVFLCLFSRAINADSGKPRITEKDFLGLNEYAKEIPKSHVNEKTDIKKNKPKITVKAKPNKKEGNQTKKEDRKAEAIGKKNKKGQEEDNTIRYPILEMETAIMNIKAKIRERLFEIKDDKTGSFKRMAEQLDLILQEKEDKKDISPLMTTEKEEDYGDEYEDVIGSNDDEWEANEGFTRNRSNQQLVERDEENESDDEDDVNYKFEDDTEGEKEENGEKIDYNESKENDEDFLESAEKYADDKEKKANGIKLTDIGIYDYNTEPLNDNGEEDDVYDNNDPEENKDNKKKVYIQMEVDENNKSFEAANKIKDTILNSINNKNEEEKLEEDGLNYLLELEEGVSFDNSGYEGEEPKNTIAYSDDTLYNKKTIQHRF